MRHPNKHCSPRHERMTREEWIALVVGAIVVCMTLLAFTRCEARGYSGGYDDDAYGPSASDKAASVSDSDPGNYLPWSYDMDGAFWNDGAAFTFIEAASTGLPGDEDFSWTLCAAGGPNALVTSDSWVLDAGSGPVYTLSAYVVISIIGNDGTVLMQVTNTTKTESFQLAWVYIGAVPTHANHTGADSYAITGPVTGDWYRVSATLDTTAAAWAGDTIYVRFRPYGADNVNSHGIGIHGVQINTGAAPTDLVEKP